MRRIEDAFQYYKERSKEVLEQVIFEDNDEQEENKSITPKDFFKLSKSEKMKVLLRLIKSHIPDQFADSQKVRDFFMMFQKFLSMGIFFRLKGLRVLGLLPMYIY